MRYSIALPTAPFPSIDINSEWVRHSVAPFSTRTWAHGRVSWREGAVVAARPGPGLRESTMRPAPHATHRHQSRHALRVKYMRAPLVWACGGAA